MKFTRTLLIVCVAAVSVAQTPNPPKSAPGSEKQAVAADQGTGKAECPCCAKMMDTKDGKSCCQHQSSPAGDKQAMSCCQGKDNAGMSCMKTDTSKSGETTEAKGQCCSGENQKGCCHKSDQSSEQTTMACCGGADGHCGATHHDHGEVSK